MLTRQEATHGEVITISLWDSYDAIERFAGSPYDRARYYPEDPRFLLEFPEHVEHYEVTLANTSRVGG
jgi:heme-degrading monooxygenase HmoA